MMKISDNIEFIIDGFPDGYVFTYMDFKLPSDKREAVIKSLNRLAISGRITKLSKGKYYKPEKSVFGELPPSQYQIVKDLIEKNGQPIGYISGYGAYNELGLTTQVPNVIQIGKNEVREPLQRGIYKISFIRQKNNITEKNIPLLKILDAIRFIKEIPDTTIDKACERLLFIIKNLENKQLESIKELVMKYPPATRALLGAFVEKLMGDDCAEQLYSSLNPITSYKLFVSDAILPNAKKWNIK